MFTGIIKDVGRVAELSPKADLEVLIKSENPLSQLDMGASIACNGVCLTVIEFGSHHFRVAVSKETVDKTTLGDWKAGTRINLERALRMGDELGGHLVSGHIDGVASVVSLKPEGDSVRYTFKAPVSLMPFVASKGSVALDGVSLTVNEVERETFGVNIIRHTREWTNFDDLVPGVRVNMEIDMLARYVHRMSNYNK
jgi:riboflavin synthase